MADDLTHSNSGTPPTAGVDIVAPLSTRTLFWRSRFLRESPFLIHVPFLFWLIETARPGCVVKLGLGDGVGYFAACQALDRVETETECVAIEPTDRATGADWEELGKYNEDNYAEFSTLLSCDLRGAANRFPDGAVDLLIVDTEVDDTLIDCLSHDWPRKLSDRAVVLFHGSATRFSEGQAAGFLSRITVTYPTARFEAGGGLTMVLFGQNRQDRLMRLAELRPGIRGYSEIHHVFRRLGAAHRFECADRENEAVRAKMQAKLQRAEAEQAQLHQEKAALERELAAAKATPSAAETQAAEALRQQLQETRAALAAAERGRSDSDRAQERLRAEIDSLKQQIERLRAGLAAAEAARDESRRALEALREELRGLTEQRDAARAELAALEEKSAAMAQALDAAQASVARLTEVRDSREAELEALRAHCAGHAKELAKLTEALERVENDRLSDAERLKAELAEVRAHRDALLASTSWRMTAPIRRIVNATRGR